MGNLSDAIFYNQPDQVERILEANPELANSFFDRQQTSFPLMKAVSLNRAQIVKLLLQRETVDVNLQSDSGETAATRAAKFGFLGILSQLHEAGCDLAREDKKNRNALDFAVLHGKYNCAQLAYNTGMDLKSDEFYEKHRSNFGNMEVNVTRMREMLQVGVQVEQSEQAQLVMAKRRVQEMVFDPNETYFEMFKSLINFSHPKMVPRDQISDPKQLPENRSLRGLRQALNWRGTNYLETVKEPLPAQNSDSVDTPQEKYINMEDTHSENTQIEDIESKRLTPVDEKNGSQIRHEEFETNSIKENQPDQIKETK